jgi:hypothetical protein
MTPPFTLVTSITMSSTTKLNTTMTPLVTPVTRIITSPTTKTNITKPPPPWIITSHFSLGM